MSAPDKLGSLDIVPMVTTLDIYNRRPYFLYIVTFENHIDTIKRTVTDLYGPVEIKVEYVFSPDSTKVTGETVRYTIDVGETGYGRTRTVLDDVRNIPAWGPYCKDQARLLTWFTYLVETELWWEDNYKRFRNKATLFPHTADDLKRAVFLDRSTSQRTFKAVDWLTKPNYVPREDDYNTDDPYGLLSEKVSHDQVEFWLERYMLYFEQRAEITEKLVLVDEPTFVTELPTPIGKLPSLTTLFQRWIKTGEFISKNKPVHTYKDIYGNRSIIARFFGLYDYNDWIDRGFMSMMPEMQKAVYIVCMNPDMQKKFFKQIVTLKMANRRAGIDQSYGVATFASFV